MPASAYLPTFLEYFWLRPETAVWRALDCAALHSLEFQPPILDLGCGDGAFSFLRAGGRFLPSYDFASQAGNLDQFFANADIYDHFDPDKALDVVARPARYRISCGFDQKRTLLAKAALTGLYEETVAGDANARLPFEDGSFATVYSNILYWLDDYPHALAEIARILRRGGRCILQVPGEHFRSFSFYQRLFVRTGDPKWEWLKLLDRGRSDNIKNCMSSKEWSAAFRRAGLAVERCHPYLPRLIIEAWDIGLRPLSPVLIEMANAMEPEQRAAAKTKWVESLLPLLLPLCELGGEETGFYLFVLSRD